MNARSILMAAAILVALGAAAYGGFWYASRQEMAASAASSSATHSPNPGGSEEQGGRKILYWHDPMFPQHKFDKPGKSPFMDMDLVPVYADEEQGSAVRIHPALTQSLGMRTAEARMGEFQRRVETVGAVQADERRITVVQSRAAGWLERLHVRAVNDPVRRGAPIAEVYAPELLAAQEEYLLLLSGTGGSELAAAARERLSLLGLTEAQIQALEKLREPARRVVLHAPSSGIVTELGAREGAAVSPGMPVASIVDLSRVWIVAQVPEMQLSWISAGQPVEATLAAMPGERYQGRVEYIYPDVDPATRTVKVRFSVQNKALKLRPGMVANVTVLSGPKRDVLLVPAEAVIRTGARTVVIVQEAEGRFRAQEVAVGLDSGDETEILAGLKPGENVVVSGQFLIDSEASLKGAIARLEAAATEPLKRMPAAAGHVAQGTVESLDAAAGKVVISHGPVVTLDWPPMTMGFAVKDKALLERLAPGQQIEFRFSEGKSGYVIDEIKPVETRR
ncbi:MAG TPA: efflux RND transporter periplasmic adaptor subunit [Burkholderiales bacterium]|nr:efflux RND transporter periplasmic adaptor subunit [Burkholderiales bacterium]